VNSKIIISGVLFIAVLLAVTLIYPTEETPQEKTKQETPTPVVAGPMPIPFFRQSGSNCVQTQMKMALGYYYPDRDYSLEFLDNLTWRRPGMWTWFPQALYGLTRLGLDAMFYTTANVT